MHLHCLWPNIRWTETLKDGFSKTGLFPFSPAVIHVTVPLHLVPLPLSQPTDEFASPKRHIRSALSRMNLPDQAIEEFVNEADRQARGLTLGGDMAQQLSQVLLKSAPEKKRKERCQNQYRSWTSAVNKHRS
jgi:hypothetical protein